MYKRITALVLLLVATGMLLVTSVHIEQSPGTFFDTTQGHLQNELDKARLAGKKGVLVMFGLTSGCGECEKVKATLLKDSAVQHYYRDNFRNLSINADSFASITDFRGRQMNSNEFANANRVVGLPTFIFYDIKGYPVARFVGVAKNVEEFLKLGRYVAEAAYERVPFVVYKQTTQ